MPNPNPNLRIQLEELQLIKCSLLPQESFLFTLPDDDSREWIKLLQLFTENEESMGAPCGDDGAKWEKITTSSTCHFAIYVDNSPLRIEVEFPRSYPGDSASRPIISVKEENMDRGEQERWQKIVKERLDEIYLDSTDFVVQNLLTLYLIPLLHESAESPRSQPTDPSCKTRPETNTEAKESTLVSTDTVQFHTLLTSHHLISPTKRRSLQKWAAELSITGFAKVGYPGVIYAEGSEYDIETFVKRIKAMQWKALRVRFEEPLGAEMRGAKTRLRLTGVENAENEGNGRGEPTNLETEKRGWVEIEKVGEVLEIMRLSGRESFVTEMGLGIAPHTDTNSGSTRSGS